jgi:hypothetical protein
LSRCTDSPRTKDHFFELEAPKILQIAQFVSKAGSVNQKEIVIADISHLPVIKLNLRANDWKTYQFSQKESSTRNNQTKGLPLFCSTQKVTG